MLLTDPHFYAFAIPAVVVLGLAKGGFAGLGNLATPLLALAIGPVKAAAILLPLMIVQDAAGVWAFRRQFDAGILKLMLPASALGIFLGFALARFVSTHAVELAVGLVSILFATRQLWIEFHGIENRPGGPIFGAACGVFAGFTSQIAHAGGPPFQMYVMPKKLPYDVFVGTTAIFFAVTNWLKVPAYVALGQFTRETGLIDLALLPIAVISTLLGVLLVRRVSGKAFYTATYILLLPVGLRLAWEGVSGLMS
ncbi:MAG: hypothetical protein JWM33_4045 [Caulobacteraceae bacterium]|nr:hypothetical protein [Caulobacteraceae bacterium]